QVEAIGTVSDGRHLDPLAGGAFQLRRSPAAARGRGRRRNRPPIRSQPDRTEILRAACEAPLGSAVFRLNPGGLALIGINVPAGRDAAIRAVDRSSRVSAGAKTDRAAR